MDAGRWSSLVSGSNWCSAVVERTGCCALELGQVVHIARRGMFNCLVDAISGCDTLLVLFAIGSMPTYLVPGEHCKIL